MPVLNARDRHLVGRFSYGVTPDLAPTSARRGGARAWFEHQLSPGDDLRHRRSRAATVVARAWTAARPTSGRASARRSRAAGR